MNIAFKGELVLDRMDFGIHGGSWGEKVLSEDIKIEFSLVAKQPNTFKHGAGELSSEMNRVVAAMKTEGIEQAMNIYEEVAGRKEINAFYTGVVAKRLMQHYYFEEALSYLEFALEKHPKQSAYYKEMAKAHLYLGNMEEAKSLFQKLISQNPYDTDALIVLNLLR